MSPQNRVYLYGLGTAVIAALVIYGIIDNSEVQVWTTVLTALLAVPMVTAGRHVPDAPDYGKHAKKD